MSIARYRHAMGLLVLVLSAGTGCSDSGPLTPTEGDAGSLMVDASTGWAHVRLGTTAAPVAVSDAATSSDWDMAFFGTSVMLNGGAAGPAGVSGYCVCQNRGATDAQVLAMTAASELADFEAVTAASIPASASEWTSDVLSPAISGWYAYDPVTHQVSADPAKVWKLRLAEATNPGYAKFHVIAIEGATQAHPGRVTIEYAVQSGLGASMGTAHTAVLDAGGGGRVHFDFARGAVTDADDWDIALEGYAIRSNSGVSGTGGAGAVLASESFAGMTDASDAPSQIYRADAYGGVFDANRWYRYNLTGSHDITPTYDVYLIRRGSDTYKVQLTGYYNEAGESRRITFRYAKVGG
jgi:hypothetical protein